MLWNSGEEGRLNQAMHSCSRISVRNWNLGNLSSVTANLVGLCRRFNKIHTRADLARKGCHVIISECP